MVSLPPYALAGMKQMLREDEDLSLAEGLENDQKLSQVMFRDAFALRNMAEIQARYDAHEPLASVLWSDTR